MLLKDCVGYDFKNRRYTVGTHDLAGNQLTASRDSINQADMDAFLAELSRSGSREDHELLAQQFVDPIRQIIPYQEMYDVFYQPWNVGELEDATIPVEDIVALAFQTHEDSEIMYVRSGFSWVRPEFVTFDTGVEVPWKALRRAGWNYLARQMEYATAELARKRDELAGNTLRAAILPSHEYLVATNLSKTIVDTVLKDQAEIGYPVTRALANPATLMAMGDFNWGGTNFQLPPEEARQLLRTLILMNYGGVDWFTNPNFPTNEVLFAGPADMVGWHLTKGSVNVASDVDITKGVDLHAIRDAEHSYYVGSALTLARIRIS